MMKKNPERLHVDECLLLFYTMVSGQTLFAESLQEENHVKTCSRSAALWPVQACRPVSPKHQFLLKPVLFASWCRYLASKRATDTACLSSFWGLLAASSQSLHGPPQGQHIWRT